MVFGANILQTRGGNGEIPTLGGLKWLLSPTTLFPLVYEHVIVSRRLANANRGHSFFPRDFWNSYEYLVHYHNKDSHPQCMVI